MRLKKLFAVFAAVIILAVGVLFVSSGLKKRTDVVLQNYFVSEDGSSLIVQTSLLGSMGYIRGMETERNGDAVECSFYCAFGGLNSSIGARNRFDIKVDDTATKVYFDRGEAGRVLVLQKEEATGAWMRNTEAASHKPVG